MRGCSLFCLAFCFVAPLSGASHAAGIEAAARAEELVTICKSKNFLLLPACLHSSLSREWKKDLDYAGKPFSAIGQFEDIRRSLVGNLFAFMLVGQYRVACQVTEKNAEALRAIGGPRSVLINGVLDSYRLSFNLHRLHHLRLTPYCSIEPAV